MKYLLTILMIMALWINTASAGKLKLPSIFSSNMVLQRNSAINIWGESNKNTSVTILTSWGEEKKIVSDASGHWQTALNTIDSKMPQQITITSGEERVIIDNILLGEVWLCSGQSNMEMPLEGWPPNDTIANSKAEIEQADFPEIRMFTVTRALADRPLSDCDGQWVVCTPATAGKFSATAYFFGKDLHQKLQLPIGLIHSSWGGTPNQAWMSGEAAVAFEPYKKIVEHFAKHPGDYSEIDTWRHKLPSISVNDRPVSTKWKNLEFDDAECSSAKYNDKLWSKMDLPCLWEQSTLGNFDGVVWFRKNLQLPADFPTKNLSLELGPIDDMDRVYINGVLVGASEGDGFWNVKRVCAIPDGILKSKKITIAIRVIDNQGGGGVYGNANDMRIADRVSGKVVSLAGTWKYMPVAEFSNGKFFVFGANPKVWKSRPKLVIELLPYQPSVLFNAMIAPLIPYTIKGAIWYQGEANATEPALYAKTFPVLIHNWREKFLQPEMPFYYAQIAPYNYGENIASQELREAQLQTLSVANTGMAVTLDIGNAANIHPANKQDVGKRLALWALAKNYSQQIPYCGPLPAEWIQQGSRFIIRFNYAENGLVLNAINGSTNFLIAGKDGVYKPASALVKGKELELWHTDILSPVSVRYCWDNTSYGTLFNSEMLPASSFRLTLDK